MADVPVWLLDVDGVLNATRPGWGGPGLARHVSVDGCTLKLRWEPKAIGCVRLLHMAGVVEVRWCTTWCPWAGTLEALWHLPTLERTWAEPQPDTWEAKLAAAQAMLDSGRRLVWTDDDLTAGDLPDVDGRALLIRPLPRRGLRPEHLHEIEQFAKEKGGLSDGIRPEGTHCGRKP
jgi:hypothetical protein